MHYDYVVSKLAIFGLLNYLENHNCMLLCFHANFVKYPFQEGEFVSPPFLQNCQKGSGEGENSLLLVLDVA